jgi:hypothetical protein
MKKSLRKDGIVLINRSYIYYFTADPRVTCTGTGTGLPGVGKHLPAKLPVPAPRVRVSAGTGTGMAKSTRGLPAMFTREE